MAYFDLLTINVLMKPEADGRQRCIQIDDRTPAEMEVTRELTVLFALARLLAPTVRPGRYGTLVCMHPEPPGFLREAVAAAGAELWIQTDPLPYEGTPPTADALLDREMRALAERVRVALEVPELTVEVLLALENALAAARPSPQDEPLRFWTKVMELAAVAGELMRAKHGLSWCVHDKPVGTVPFGMRGGAIALANVFGRVEHFLRGHGAPPSEQLEKVARGAPAYDPDKAIVSLKNAAAAAVGDLMSWPLLDGVPGSPLVVIGIDGPTAVALLERNTPVDAGHARRDAIKNLAALPAQIAVQRVDDLRLAFVNAEHFSSEKVLDVALMRSVGQQLGASTLVAAIPRKGLLTVMAKPETRSQLARFLELAKRRAEEADHGEPLTMHPLELRDGVLEGVLPEPPEDAKRPSLWQRIWGAR